MSEPTKPYKCPACTNNPKRWQGSDRRCAFDAAGNFVSDNWNCALINELVGLCTDGSEKLQRSNDSTIGLLPVDIYDSGSENTELIVSGWLVMLWYKSRGRTDRMFAMNEDHPHQPVNYTMAIRILNYLDLDKAMALFDPRNRKKCIGCEGLTHRNDCPQWVLPY